MTSHHAPLDLQRLDPANRRSLLAGVLSICTLAWVAQLLGVMQSAAIGYLLAAALALFSNRHWHVILIAALSAALLAFTPLALSDASHWQSLLQGHAMAIFALAVIAAFGSASIRRAQAEASAMAEAVRSRNETAELRTALARAEHAEADNRRMVERMRMANDSAGLSVWEWHIQDDSTWVADGGPAIERLGGLSQFKGSMYANLFVHPDERERWHCVFRDALRGPGNGFSHRYRIVDRNQQVRNIQLHASILRNAQGRAVSVLGIDWDVTEEERSRQEIARQAQQLRIIQERFQRAVQGTQDALFEFNLQTGKIWHSPRFRQMLGYPRDTGEPAPEAFVHPDDSALVGRAMSAHIQHGAPYDVEYRLRRRDGSWLWVRSRATAERDAERRPLWLSGSIHDMTQEREARECMLRATEEATAASRAKSTFLATMSHEIRTPMNGIIGMTGLLLDSSLDRVQREYAQTIRASADSLLTILNDILDFSKIEAGKLEIETLEMDLRALVDDVGAMMAFQAAAKGLELVINVRPEVPERVLGDPQRIRQCLLNLVGNAIKFTSQGEVVLEVCLAGHRQGRALVHFEVRDTGIGIEQDSLDSLFQPFTQADSSTTRRFGGTGLGLSIVRRLVELMAGQSGALSQPRQGSIFWFTLALEEATARAPLPHDTLTPRSRHILLVDDNATNRRVLASQMSHAGYRVTVAGDVHEALSMLIEAGDHGFDVVLLDYQMPDMDGAQLGERILAHPQIAPTRLMLLTSLDRSGDLQRCADLGFSAYLTKPVRVRELLDCLSRALSHQPDDWHLRSQPIITRGTLVASERRNSYAGDVLVVEDNAINQRVAQRFLERLGCKVHVVGDGAQALSATQRQHYSLILMDMQMPVMDGLQATRRIRAREANDRHTPIVALTANAMMGTLERCLNAGMDDYLTKPLDILRLRDVLDRFMGSTTVADTQTQDQDAGAVRRRLQELAEGDDGFMMELVETFIDSASQALTELHAAIEKKDAAAISSAAHKLKGAASNLHMHELTEHAATLEKLPLPARLDEAAQRMQVMQDHTTRMGHWLQQLMAREACDTAGP